MGFFSNLIDRIRGPDKLTRLQMMMTQGNAVTAWDGNMWRSDIIRSCIRPKAKAIGKMELHHVRDMASGKQIDPEAFLRFLLTEPNPYMTMQIMLEYLVTTKDLTGNAYALILRDGNGLPTEIYPIPASTAEAVVQDSGELCIRFNFRNGHSGTVPYTDLIHLRGDFAENDLFGTAPKRALTDAMEIINAADQSVVAAVKNGSAIKWITKLLQPKRPEDIRLAAKEFAQSFLMTEDGGFGVAAIDNKVELTPVQPSDYVPNAAVTKNTVNRIREFYGTNEKITTSAYNENEWIAYYESAIEPDVKQISEEFSRKLFTRRERAVGNRIIAEAASLQYASMAAKLQLVQFVDRGILTPNELRSLLALAPVEGGDVMIRRLDTAPVSTSEEGGEGE